MTGSFRAGTGRRLTRPYYLLAAAAGLAANIACAAEVECIFPGYAWQNVADGVYVHSAMDPLAGPVDGNSVVIVGDDSVVVVDTHINPAAARAVIARIRELTDRPVTHVVNTHFHDDHTNGNYVYRAAFPEAKIVAHRATLEALKREWPPMEAQRREGYAQLSADEILARADALDDPVQAAAYRVFAGYVAALKPELPGLELVYPDTVFDESFEIDAGNRKVVLEWPGRGNTDGDLLVRLPDQEVLITGDLLVAPIPFAFDSPMVDWIATLDRLAELDADVIIPGHGPVQHDRQHLDAVRDLLRATVDEVRAAHDAGAGLADLAAVVDLTAQQAYFAGSDAESLFAWQSYFLQPGLRSAWIALGYPLPEDN